MADASPLIGLAKAGRLDLLPRLYGPPVLIPPRVYVDVVIDGKGRIGARAVQNAIARGWLQIVPVEDRSLIPARFAGMGEGEAIALALEKHADVLLIDDRAARSEAARRGLSWLSTGGILVDAHGARVLRSVRPVLARMRMKGFGIGNEEELLRSVGSSCK
ncbi:MAG: DUF3368 domain-containing protein [Chloroflexi bacterium]|nr:DUF3368 domain-containing protein [Chloroflexota bacterium]